MHEHTLEKFFGRLNQNANPSGQLGVKTWQPM